MCRTRTRFFRRLVAAALFAATPGVASAQDKQRETQKPAGTVDAWRQALPPQAETEFPAGEAAAGTTARASREEVERFLLAQGERWMESLRLRDASALDQILSDDFTLADARLPGAQVDKQKYLAHALHDLKLSSYEFDKLSVRLYGRTAVVSGRLKQTASAGGADWSGSQIVTDVWVHRDGFWRAVSRHASPLPEAK